MDVFKSSLAIAFARIDVAPGGLSGWALFIRANVHDYTGLDKAYCITPGILVGGNIVLTIYNR